MKIEMVPISKLKLLENNPRRISKDQMEKLCKSIEDDPKFLECRPCLVSKRDGILTVYAGNQRVRAAKKLKLKEIPCIVEEFLTDEMIKERTIKDNKTYGEFDFDILANNYDIEMLVGCGFAAEELLGDLSNISDDERVADDGEVLEPTKDPKTKYGDLYELGKHRLLCGDSTNKEDVDRVLDGAIPILMVTDQPYGVMYDPEWRDSEYAKTTMKMIPNRKTSIGKVINDDRNDWTDSYKLFPGQVSYVWHAAIATSTAEISLQSAGFVSISQIIWRKQHFCLSRGDYHWQHETCIYSAKKNKNHNWQGSRKESTVWDISNQALSGGGEEKFNHSTQKPIECMARPIRNNSAEGEGVYDPFLGSGTTLIACEKLNRICYGLEICPAYCDMIVERWCKLNGKKAKRNGMEIDEL